MCLDPVIMLTAATSALSIANTSAQIAQQNKMTEATAKLRLNKQNLTTRFSKNRSKRSKNKQNWNL